MNHWCFLSSFFFTRLFLCISTALTVTNTLSAFLFHIRVGLTNSHTCGAVLTSCCSGHFGSSMQLLCSISVLLSAAQSSSLSFGLSKSTFQSNQSLVSEMHSGRPASLLLTGWQLILRIQSTFNISVHPPGRSFADKAGGHGDLSDNINAATTSCWKSYQDALTNSSGSELYPWAFIWLFRVLDCFCVARQFWLPCEISKKSWTLAILCYFLAATSFFISESFSVLVVSKFGSVPAKIPVFTQATSLTTTCSQRVSPVLCDSLQLITPWPREKLASIPTPCGMIETMSRTTLERSAYFECVSPGCRHQSAMSGTHNVLLIAIELEWLSLRFWLKCPKFFSASGGEFLYSLAAVNNLAARSFHPGVVWSALLGVQYSSSSLDNSDGSKDDW